MKHVKVAELKARLSRYLAEVRRGERLVVCDRTTPIAWLTPYDGEGDAFQIVGPTQPAADIKRIEPVRLRRRVDVVALLRESRDQR